MERYFRIVLVILLLPVGALRADGVHVVRRGDTLSGIAQKYLGRPVYAPDSGSLARLLRMNSDLDISRLIFPGQRILVSGNAIEQRAPATVDAGPVAPAPSAPVAASAIEAAGPAENPAPSLSPKDEVAHKDEVGHFFSPSLQFADSTLFARDLVTGGRSELYSKMDLAISLGLRQRWNADFDSVQSFTFRSLEIEPSSNPLKTLTGTSQSMTRILVGGQRNWNDAHAIRLTLERGDQAFVRGQNLSVIAVDAVPLWSVSLDGRIRLYAQSRTSFGMRVGAAYVLGAENNSYTIEPGREVRGLLYIERSYGRGQKFVAEFGAVDRKQDTSYVEMNEQRFHLGVATDFPLFGGGTW